jgi:hypothetical protein
MKKRIFLSVIGTSAVMILALVMVLAACSKKDESTQPVNSGITKAWVPLSSCISGSPCADLIAGQNTNVGNVCITDNGTLLVVTYTADLNYSFTAIHFWCGLDPNLIPMNKQHNPQPGQFPYVFSFTTPKTLFSFNVPYPTGWTCDQPFAIAAHAVFGTETAWGAGSPINPGQGSWGTFSCIQVGCYVPNNICTSYQLETGWGGGLAGPGNGCSGNGGGGWWFYYDNTVGGDQDIMAGQTYDAGYVTYDATNGTLVITLEDGWELRPDLTNTVKVGYYDVTPTCRPNPGSLPIKLDVLTVPVSNHSYYAIHLDLRKCTQWQ